jgi:ferric-dicitrate binding protein FerR (iron transport regulator)
VNDELLDLAAAVCHGTITPEQHARLEQLLAADPAARQRYFDYLDLHLALGQTHAAGRVPQAARRPRRWIAAAAAAVLIGAVLYAVTRGPSPAAILEQSAAARFYGAGERLRVGDPLDPAQDYALKSGRA